MGATYGGSSSSRFEFEWKHPEIRSSGKSDGRGRWVALRADEGFLMKDGTAFTGV